MRILAADPNLRCGERLFIRAGTPPGGSWSAASGGLLLADMGLPNYTRRLVLKVTEVNGLTGGECPERAHVSRRMGAKPIFTLAQSDLTFASYPDC